MQEIKRVYSKDLEFDTDLFKLEVADMLKNAGFDDRNPILQNAEHCHFYRTFDSNGKAQDKCHSVAGHYHEVKVSVDKDGNLKAKVSEAIGTKFNDKHTHKAIYIKSDKVKKRTMNEDAARQIAMFNAPKGE